MFFRFSTLFSSLSVIKGSSEGDEILRVFQSIALAVKSINRYTKISSARLMSSLSYVDGSKWPASPCIWRTLRCVSRSVRVFGVGGVAPFGSACILFIFVWHCYPAKCQKQTKLNSKNASSNNNYVEKCLRRYGADKRTQYSQRYRYRHRYTRIEIHVLSIFTCFRFPLVAARALIFMAYDWSLSWGLSTQVWQ